jgi:hypothetical protein
MKETKTTMTNFPDFPAPARGLSYACVPSDPKLKEIAEKRIAIIKRMTDALFEYLTFNEQLTIDTFDIEPPKPSANMYGYTVESLMRAQSAREQTQSQIDKLENAIDALPEGTAGDLQESIMESMMLVPLRAQLEQQDSHIADIQKALEGENLERDSSDKTV